ncbi:hypothetical protein NPIL_637851 [Nephila pilipes]|uniref:Uncharacterized protein n=1 Tax=Nephila pilipes TaxID=299642 RepID=A0A8X6PKP1_NEPPI|nr:hypothetical protein NPIL_637851 [Nephila pilipes]
MCNVSRVFSEFWAAGGHSMEPRPTILVWLESSPQPASWEGSHKSIGPKGANLLIRDQGCGPPVVLLGGVRTLMMYSVKELFSTHSLRDHSNPLLCYKSRCKHVSVFQYKPYMVLNK